MKTYKVYDTINGTFVSDLECTLDEIKSEVQSGKYSEYELENWTAENTNDETDSVCLGDLLSD